MKNIKLIIAVTFVLAALSCQKEETYNSYSETDQNLVPLILSTGEPTKTYIAGDGVDKDIYWSSDDKIMVYCDISPIGSTPYSDEFSMPANYTPAGTHARFEGNVYMGSNLIWAVYPSSAALQATEDGVLTVRLPSEQVSCDGSFDKGCNISISKSDISKLDYSIDITHPKPVINGNVKFENVCSLLKFRIPSGVTNVTSVTISTDNDIAGDLQLDYTSNTPSFDGFVKESSTNIITMTGTFAENTDYYFVLAPVAISELSIFVNTRDNKQYAATRAFSTPLQLNAGEYKSIGTLNLANMPSFEVDFDIQDDGGFLNGTDVIFSFPSDNISNLYLTVTNKGGSVVRTIKVNGPVALNEYNQYISSYANETVSTWPYLPKGNYTVSGSYTTEAGDVSVSNFALVINTDPNFTVGSFDASTTYNKYVNEGASVANTYTSDGNTIWVTADDVAISDKILKNSNYKDMIQVQFVAPAQGYGVANLTNGLTATLTNQQYGEYKSPSYIFDEKAVTFSKLSCHVTGLPYVLNPAANDSVNPWTESGNVAWNQGGSVRLGYNLSNWFASNKASISKTFHVPANVKLLMNCSGKAVGTGSKGWLGDSRVNTTFSVNVSGESFSYQTTNGEKEQTFAFAGMQCELTNGNPEVTLSNSYSTATACSKVQSLVINYR